MCSCKEIDNFKQQANTTDAGQHVSFIYYVDR